VFWVEFQRYCCCCWWCWVCEENAGGAHSAAPPEVNISGLWRHTIRWL